MLGKYFALCLKNHEKVSFLQMDKFGKLLRDKYGFNLINLDKDSVNSALFYYSHLFKLKVGEKDEREKFRPGYILRNKQKFFKGNYSDNEFFHNLKERELNVDELLEVINSLYKNVSQE